MRLFSSSPKKKAVSQITKGAQSYQGNLADEESRLAELFHILKHELLSALSHDLGLSQLRVFRKQVRHVISVARAIGYGDLEQSCIREEEIIDQLIDLLEKYPAAELANSTEVAGAIKNLRSMVEQQQEMIFTHKEILLREKQRVVDILQDASELASQQYTSS